MTAKQFVQEKLPNASARKYSTRTGFHSYSYYLIRNGNEFMYIAEGETESLAWKAAKEKIENGKYKINSI